MSAVRELLDAEAAVARRALPARSRRLVHISDNARQLVLFQLAGNDFSVVGMAFGRPGHRADHVVTCPDPLDRADVAARLEPIRDDMLSWLRSHPVVATTDHERAEFAAAEAPQLVVAGTGVITALDNLAYDWRFNPNLDASWHELGEELWMLCSLRRRPGQFVILPLAETLAEHYALGISSLEAAKLAVAVELCDAGPTGVDVRTLREAEITESGPLGRPDELDEPVWRAARAGRSRAPAIAAATVRGTWDRCNRAWRHITAFPEAACATRVGTDTTGAWAWLIGPVRTGVGFRRRRALPALAAAATEHARLEHTLATFSVAAALEDPMVAAELAGEGKAWRVDLTFAITRAGRTKTINIEATTNTPTPPPSRALVALGGTNVKARVVEVSPDGTGWRIRLFVGATDRETSGVNTFLHISDGTFWLVPAAKGSPATLGSPPAAPSTHSLANGRTSAAVGP